MMIFDQMEMSGGAPYFSELLTSRMSSARISEADIASSCARALGKVDNTMNRDHQVSDEVRCEGAPVERMRAEFGLLVSDAREVMLQEFHLVLVHSPEVLVM